MVINGKCVNKKSLLGEISGGEQKTVKKRYDDIASFVKILPA